MLRMLLIAIASVIAGTAIAFATPPPKLDRTIDAKIEQIMRRDNVPGLSLLVAQGDRVYVRGYGYADLATGRRVTPDTPFKIGSNSKQFTAVAILMLAEAGKLSVDDRVSKFYPDLQHSDEITLRELLTHTSGYTDFYPLDYLTPEFFTPVDPEMLAAEFARKPLDFKPGTQWQYSNTNYTILGNIVELESGMTLADFLNKNVFARAGLHHTHYGYDRDAQDGTAVGYTRFAFSAPVVSPTEAPGWTNGAGSLESTPSDILKWNQALFSGRVLQPRYLKMMITPAVLPSGKDTRYAFGVAVSRVGGHLFVRHSGGVGGQVSLYYEFPDQHTTIVALSNSDYDFVDIRTLARTIADELGVMPKRPSRTDTPPPTPSPAPDARKNIALVSEFIAQLQSGTLDRSKLTPQFSGYLTPELTASAGAALRKLGTPLSVTQTDEEVRGGMQSSSYRIVFRSRTAMASMYRRPSGNIDQILLY